jgi:hypothetical protein
LYFSELDADVRASLLPEKLYLKIINHQNYTPRLIDDIARRAKLDGTSASDFPAYFVGILDDPKTLWQHTFDNSISAEARLVLLSLASLPSLTTITALRAVYDALQANATAKPFFYALKEVDGDFLRTTQSGALTVVSFFNPSVRDFVLARLWDSVALRDRLLGTVPFFEQVLALNQSKPEIFGGPAFERALVRTLDSDGCVVIARGEPGSQVYDLSVMTKVARFATTLQHASAEVTAEGLTAITKKLAGDWSEGYFSVQGEILELVNLIQSQDPGAVATLVEAIRVGLRGKEFEDMDDAEFARDFMNMYDDAITDEDREIIGEFAELFVNVEIEYLRELKDPEEIRDRFSKLESLADAFGNTISYADGLSIDELIEGIQKDNEQYDDWDGDRSGDYQRLSGADENAAIDDLFDSMDRD